MMWFQRHEEPKTITDDYEQVNEVSLPNSSIDRIEFSRVHISFSIMNVGKHVNGTILSLNTSFWKIENFENMLVVHDERERKRVKK